MNETKFLHRDDVIVCSLALLIACVLAANQITQGGLLGWLASYAYWIVRIFIEAALFFTALNAIEKYLASKFSTPFIYLLSVLVSLIPFTLVITTIDLIIGLPELGLNGASVQTTSRWLAFGKELIYLLDNHAALCALLLLPRLLKHSVANSDAANTNQLKNPTEPETAHSFFDTLDPPLTGRIYWIEAQEHYVQVTTTSERRLVLHRFSDAIRELPEGIGMQVHRSHWVAFADFEALQRDGQNMKLQLLSGELVPVSRSYRQQVEQKINHVPT
jgi:hypothetical protein